ncbi:unnamed protein product [Staurois parvus]|uniref:Uncharacterized protein n=1 Tax=Staurois parvus TaxID=386267 RepID=A0ABN9DCC6_9NEOB|nr:unnamed protein product [Staurois parvus]
MHANKHCTNGTGQEGVNIWGDQRVNFVLCVFLLGKQAALLLCRAIQSSLFLLTGEISVLSTYRLLPCQLCC